MIGMGGYMNRKCLFMLLVMFPLIGAAIACDREAEAAVSEPPSDTVTTETVPADNLLLHFEFEEDGESTVTSVTGRLGDNETYINYVFNQAKYKKNEGPERVVGVVGNALKLDGYSTYIRYNSVNITTGAITVAGWVAPRTWNAQKTGGAAIIDQYDEKTQRGFRLGYDDYGKFSAKIATISQKGKTVVYSFVLDENRLNLYQWNFLALSFDEASSSLCLYLNGERIKEMECYGSFSNADVPLLIGRRADAIKVSDASVGIYRYGMVSGLLDEIQIFDRALSNKELDALYERGLTANGELPSCHYDQLMPNSSVISDDKHIQRYHIRSNGLWQGELFSPFYYNGTYHMFSHRHLNAPLITYGVWGHYVSTDLLHWKEVLPAIAPSDETNIAEDQCFSGTGAIDANGIPYIFFTGVTNDVRPLNRISYATAADPSDGYLMEWKKSNEVIINQPDFCSDLDFRDPYIYTEGEYAFMLVGSSTQQPSHDLWERDPLVMVYRAKLTDLSKWEELGAMYRASRETYPEVSFNWELPYLYRLTNDDETIVKYMLAVSPHPHPSPREGENDTTDASLLYWLGSFDTETGVFTPEQDAPLRFDMGNITSAISCAFPDPVSGEWLSYSVIHTHYSESQSCYHGYNVHYSIPRVLSLHDDGTLRIRPYSEMETLHTKTWVNTQNLIGDEMNAILSEVKSEELHVKLSVRLNGCDRFGLNIKQSDISAIDAGERTALVYDAVTQTFTVDSSHSTNDSAFYRPVSQGKISPDDEGVIQIEFYLDNSTVEVFVNETLLISSPCYSTLEDSLGMQFYYEGAAPEILNLEIYEMEILYEAE